MKKIESCDIYELGGFNYQERLIISSITVEIEKTFRRTATRG